MNLEDKKLRSQTNQYIRKILSIQRINKDNNIWNKKDRHTGN